MLEENPLFEHSKPGQEGFSETHHTVNQETAVILRGFYLFVLVPTQTLLHKNQGHRVIPVIFLLNVSCYILR